MSDDIRSNTPHVRGRKCHPTATDSADLEPTLTAHTRSHEPDTDLAGVAGCCRPTDDATVQSR
eukprot:7601231-Prorocentrum_lima.AAC.1